MKLRRAQVTLPGFHRRVEQEFHKRGVKPVAPKRHVFDFFKDVTFKHASDARDKWPEPYMPFLLQMRGGYFHLFSSWQDGLWFLRETAGIGCFKHVHRVFNYGLCFENQIENIPSRMILDCEAYASQFNSDVTLDDLETLISGVPEWITQRLVETGAIPRDKTVIWYKKRKSRGDKASAHFISNILGVPTLDIARVLREIILKPFEGIHREHSKTKMMTHMEKADLNPGMMVDPVPTKGRGQFAIPVSKKDNEPEYPRVTHVYRICQGVCRIEDTPWAKDDQGPEHGQVLDILMKGCYTTLIKDCVTLNPDLMGAVSYPQVCL